MPGTLKLRAALLSLCIFAFCLAIWHVATLPVEKAANADPEYAKMVGGGKSSGLPSPAMIARTIWANVTDPFYDHGPNDKGIGIQLAYSMARVGLGFTFAAMLVGGTGIGYFVWNEWNNLSLTNVIFAILTIGVVGMLLDLIFGWLTRLVSYQE